MSHAPDLSVRRLFSAAIEGKRALVTGGAGGLGMMMSAALVQNGAHVYIASRKEKDLRLAVETLNKMGPGSAEYIVADLSSKAGCDSLADAIKARTKKLDILCNNSGASWGAYYNEVDEKKGWDRVYDLNVKGLFYLTVALTDLLAKDATNQDPGRVINIASVAGIDTMSDNTALALPGQGLWSYYSSKAAAIHLTKLQASTLGPRFITVNAICPGVFPSKMSAHGVDTNGEALAKAAPMKRLGETEDMAGLLLFLCSRGAAHISGVEIPIDGGAMNAGASFSNVPPAKL